MSAKIVFMFDPDVTGEVAVHEVANFFGLAVSTEPAGETVVPAYIKQAVENTAAYLNQRDDPTNGVEMSPAIAFGGLMNGGNVSAPSSVDAAASQIAHGASPATSATLPPASLAPVAPTVNTGAVAPVASAGTVNPVDFDSTGLAWDERIHSANKTKTDKGAWRGRKGADKSLTKAVELELRAKYPNSAIAGTVTSAPVVAGLTTNAPVSDDPALRKVAALNYAHGEALRVAGPQQIDDKTLADLCNGKPVTLAPNANEWFSVYWAKRNAAFTEYMGNAQNAPVVPAAPPAPPMTGANPDALLAPTSVASQTVAATQVPAVPTAPHSPADLDAAGLPWDARINIPAKIKDAAGVWVQRFDVSPESKLAVMAELRGNVAAAPSVTPAGAAGSTPVAPPPPAAGITPAEAGADFAKLMQWIVSNQMAGRITATAGPDAAKAVGFADVNGNGQLVLAREQTAAWPYIVQILQAQGAL